MDWEKKLFDDADEKPLDSLVDGYSNTGIFRTMAFIGDSLASGEFESRGADGKPGFHDYFEYSWGQYIARKNGLKAYNFSRGGMTAREYMESFAQSKGYWDPALACQGYVIALGVNDVMNRGMEIGSIDDIDASDWRNNKPTFVGYYAQIIARIKEEIQPDAKFFLVTMMRNSEETKERDEKRKKHAEAIYALSEYFDNAYVVDLYKYGPDNNTKYRERFSLYGHLNPMGYIMIAKMVDSCIDYIIRKNPAEFSRVPFIGTELK